MRRLALLAMGGALWLFAAAIPALADGGPHVAAINNGSAGLTSDNCAGCHRAHTAQAAMLLKEEGTALCTACHGSAGTGATTNVADGVQYQLAAAGGPTVRRRRARRPPQWRLHERPDRISYPSRQLLSLTAGTGTGFAGFVPAIATGTPVSSKHMSLTGETAATVWGNGPISATANVGATVTLECTSCHNPHGNGNYRILNPIPAPPSTGSPAFVPAVAGVNVTDAALPATGTTRNYTVQPGALTTDVTGGVTGGDYWRRCVPDWQNCSGTNRGDKPNGLTLFRQQISAWCTTCHSRYPGGEWRSAAYRGRAERRRDLRLPAHDEYLAQSAPSATSRTARTR